MSTENSIAVESKSTLENLQAVVEKHPLTGRHSYFQLKYFIVGKEPTPQAKIWQCLREMKARRDALEAIQLERDETNDRIELAEIDIERLKNPRKGAFGIDVPEEDELTLKRREIKIRQSERKLKSMKKALKDLDARQKDTEEEAAFFLQAFADLTKNQKVIEYDDFNAQKEYWTTRFSNEMNMKFMLDGRVDGELAKAILSLPDETVVKQEMFGILNRQQEILEAKRLMEKKQLAQMKVALNG
jgi:hypothetical protein